MDKLELEVYNYLIYRGGQGYYFCPTQTQYGKKEFKKKSSPFCDQYRKLAPKQMPFQFSSLSDGI